MALPRTGQDGLLTRTFCRWISRSFRLPLKPNVCLTLPLAPLLHRGLLRWAHIEEKAALAQ
eukprot:11144620-Karenia_brevis.AAC.1